MAASPQRRRDLWLGGGTALLLLGLLWLLLHQALAQRGLGLDFSTLTGRAGFRLSESLLDISPDSPAWMAILAGLLNTLRAALLGAFLAVLLALPLALARISNRPLARTVAAWIVEPLRNTPLPLQLFLWYGVLLNLPGPRSALHLAPGLLLSNRGLAVPWFEGGTLSWPALAGFNIEGGLVLSPEFTALAFGLGLFHAAYLAEVLRAGIAAVPPGQIEAASALGLRRWRILRLIVLPQALAFSMAPATWQFLQLMKNASLGLLIGYPDLVGVTGIAVNQTGRGLEGLILVILAYLGLNGLMVLLLRRMAPRSAHIGLQAARPLPQAGRRLAHTWPALLLAAMLGALLFFWGLRDAAFTGGSAACTAAQGACWALLSEKWRLILFGSYPLPEQLRPTLATALLALAILATAWGGARRPGRIGLAWLVILPTWLWLMGGGAGLVPVASMDWGGLPLTLGLAVAATALGAALALPLALATLCRHPALRVPAAMFIALFRSVPLIALLLASSVLLPLLLPTGWNGDKLPRALAALIGVTAAQLAEILRRLSSAPGRPDRGGAEPRPLPLCHPGDGPVAAGLADQLPRRGECLCLDGKGYVSGTGGRAAGSDRDDAVGRAGTAMAQLRRGCLSAARGCVFSAVLSAGPLCAVAGTRG